MMIRPGAEMHFQTLNEAIRSTPDTDVMIENCLGQRYIGAGLSGKTIVINGTPGNALGAYLDGCTIHVHGNSQEATGDTMNEGTIYVHGNAGDATGYAMRGGKIFIEGNSGYRTGIHMKAFQEKVPVLVVGGITGSFLGEYQAGGYIIVLDLNHQSIEKNCNFVGTGMHGGKIFLRTEKLPPNLPKQILASQATKEDLKEIKPFIHEFCEAFDREEQEILDSTFYVLTPNSNNPYKQLYTRNQC